jgi:hypothetical protein
VLAGATLAVAGQVLFLVFKETGRFSAVFAVAAAFLLASIPFLRRIGDGGCQTSRTPGAISTGG